MGCNPTHRIMRHILTIVFILNYLVGYSQINDSSKSIVDSAVTSVITEARKGNVYYDNTQLFLILSSNPMLSYLAFREYKDDVSEQVLNSLVTNYKWLRRISDDTLLRQKITLDLLQLYQRYKEPLNGYNTFDIPSGLSKPEDNKMSDFNEKAKQLLVELLQDSLINKNILKITGIAGEKGLLHELQEFLPEGERYQKFNNYGFYFSSWEWYARLAMARLGDKDQINFCLQRILEKEDEIISNYYSAKDYFDDLVYIKQPEILPFLFKMLIANKEFEEKPLFSTSGLAINALQKLLVGFPPEVGFSLTEKGVKEYKKWVRENKGKYIFKD